jgi:hypothetical protein
MNWGRSGGRGRIGRPLGCLLWLVALLLLIVLLSALFGGFQKGTKVGGPVAPRGSTVAAAVRAS